MINRNIDGYVSKIKRHYGINQSTGYARVPCPFHNGTDKIFLFKLRPVRESAGLNVVVKPIDCKKY